MGRIGVNKRLKRSNAPRIWPVHRKEYVWVFKPSPGPHPISSSLPIALLLRDLLHIAKFAREAKKIISKGMVKIDGRVIKDPGFPVGVMDVISIPEIESIYRVFPSKKSLTLHPISKEEEDMKLCRIESKRVLKGGRTQLNLHDGRNVHLVPSEGLENNYALFDVLKIKLSDRSVLEKIKFANGMYVMIIGGKHRGKFGRITAIEEGERKLESLITVEGEVGERFQTALKYVFVIGSEQPSISIPKVAL